MWRIQYLDFSAEDDSFRRDATHLIIKLAARSDLFPASLYVEDATLNQDFAHMCGGYADVYQGARSGELVAIKKPRFMGSKSEAYQVLQSHDEMRSR
jgi:hypothetical protein